MNRMTRTTASAAAACAVVGGLVLVGAPAQAATSALSSDQEASMRQTWDNYGVSPATQDRLIGELEQGRLWDSLSGGAVVSSATHDTAGQSETVDTYADGSIRITDVQKPIAQTSPSRAHILASIGSCKTIEVSHYDATYQCTVSTNVVVSSAAYTVTYHQVQGSNSQITANSPLITECNVGTCSDKRMLVGRKTQSGSKPAFITGYWTWTAVGGGSSKDYWLESSVRGGSTSASNN